MRVKPSKKAGVFNKPRSEYLKLAKKKLAKTKETTESKKHTVKTQSGTKETVSRDDLKAAGDLYDRLKKREDVDYGLQDSTKESLGRFIENSLFDGESVDESSRARKAHTRKLGGYKYGAGRHGEGEGDDVSGGGTGRSNPVWALRKAR